MGPFSRRYLQAIHGPPHHPAIRTCTQHLIVVVAQRFGTCLNVRLFSDATHTVQGGVWQVCWVECWARETVQAAFPVRLETECAWRWPSFR